MIARLLSREWNRSFIHSTYEQASARIAAGNRTATRVSQSIHALVPRPIEVLYLSTLAPSIVTLDHTWRRC
jgi:hypothetical protein